VASLNNYTNCSFPWITPASTISMNYEFHRGIVL
jgi:hypothetical protein